MPKKKLSMTNPHKTDAPKSDFTEQIKTAVADLFYISETDAAITGFIGKQAKAVTVDEIRNQTKTAPDSSIEEKKFDEFINRLTVIKDWFGDEEKATAQKFTDLKSLLEANLKDLTVFKIGKIQIDVYAVGLDAENRLTGIHTKAVET